MPETLLAGDTWQVRIIGQKTLDIDLESIDFRLDSGDLIRSIESRWPCFFDFVLQLCVFIFMPTMEFGAIAVRNSHRFSKVFTPGP